MGTLNNKPTTDLSSMDLVEAVKSLGFGELHLKHDAKTGLTAFIAIHSTTLGPALGGCRCLPYDSSNEAIVDVLRLAQGMSYKAAISNIPHGGGKSVIIRPQHINDREAFFKSFGSFVDSLNGRYITAEDSGTDVSDMHVIRQVTPYVTGVESEGFINADPSPLTALGTRRGIEAAVKFKLGKDNLQGIHVAIQGCGNVGYNLAKELHELGATITAADVNVDNLKRVQAEFGAKIVDTDDIHKVKCDVFAPCALGSSINATTIKELNTEIIAGAANNQLAQYSLGQELLDKGILYAPDYAINAGGLIHVTAQYSNSSETEAKAKVLAIYDTMLTIFTTAKQQQLPTNVVADNIAEKRLQDA